MKTQHLIALPAFTLAALYAHAQVGTEQATDPASAVDPSTVEPASESVLDNSRVPAAAPTTIQPPAVAPMPAMIGNEGDEGLSKLMDSRLDNIENSLQNAPTAEEREQARAELATLRQRREALKQNYDQGEFDRLMEDSRAEFARVASWSSKRTGDQTASPPDAIARDGSGAPTGNDRTYAALNLPANQALANIEVYRLNPSPDNKQEVKGALKALDKEIDRLSDQAGDLPRGEERDSAKRRVKALKQRYSELKKDFTKARWDAMVDDLRAEWTRMTH
ncbi:MAG: hypothetical protein SFV32_02785 [Opitutaceae bacterium]|nr:hypothetical protein [Opitutaceae bacterium]